MQRSWLILALLFLAVALAGSLLEYAQVHQTTYTNRIVRSRPDQPIVLLEGSVADFGANSSGLLAAASERGIFARRGIPRLVAIVGGLLVPLLIVAGSSMIAINRRWFTIAGLCAMALLASWSLLSVHREWVVFGNTPATSATMFDPFENNRVAEVPILTSSVEVNQLPHGGSAAWVTGWFPEYGVPRSIAIGLGLVMPALLALSAFILLIYTFLFQQRKSE